MKKRILVILLSLFILGVWGNLAFAKDAQNSPGNSGAKTVKTQQPAPKHQKEFKHIKLVTKESATQFKDMENDWANAEVVEATVKGYVYGYEDCTFRPNSSVSKLETLVLIENAQGLADEVKNYQLSDEQKTLLAKIPDWGKNYVAVAIDQGILTKEELAGFNPQQAAKRYEVCMYMSRILAKDDTTASTAGNVFTDENQIPTDNLKDVLAMWKNGVVRGYPDGSFNPMRAVKRNEIITMLNKLDDNCLKNFDSSTVKGTVKEIKAIENGLAISVENEKGEVVTVNTSSQTKLIYEGHLLSTSIDLKSSQKVRILLGQDGKAVLVRVLAD